MTTTEVQSASKKGRNPLTALFLTIFIDLVGFSILIPVFPLLIGTPRTQAFRVTPQSWTYRDGLIMSGWLQAVYPLCIFLAAPVLGQLSDRIGRRPVLALSIAGTAVGYAIFAIGIQQKSIPLLFLGRSLDGITGGNLAVAQAAVGDISNNENRSKNFGLIGAAFGLGFILGPYIGGKLSQPNVSFYGLFHTPSWFGATTPFWFAGIMAALNAAFVFFTLPETLVHKTDRKINWASSFVNVKNGFATERFRTILSSAFFWTCGFTFFTSFFGFYVANKFNFSQGKTGDFFAIVGLCIAIVQGGIVGVMAKKFPDFKILRWAIPYQAVSLAIIAAVTKSWMLYLTIPVLALSQGLCQANLGALMSRSAVMGKQGEAMGIYSSVNSLAQVPASVLVGYVASGSGSNTPIVVAAVLSLIAGVIFAALFKPKFVSNLGAGAPAPSGH